MALLGFAVEKNGTALMANKNTFRTFKTRENAWKFVSNLIWVSNSLTKDNFRLIKVHGRG